MTKKIILTYGIFGVGKTYYGQNYVQEHPEYKLVDIERDIDKTIEKISKHEYVICDYYFHLDKGLEKLRALGEVEIVILFDKPENITFRQVILKGNHKSDIGIHLSCRTYAVSPLHALAPQGCKCSYYDCSTKQHMDFDEFKKRFAEYCKPYTKEEIEKFISWIKECKGHDYNYQLIELPYNITIGRPDYANNKETWEAIKDMIDWKGKTVIDFGCFHGYFCREIAKKGGIPMGVDKSSRVIYVAAIINKILGVHCPLAVYDLDNEFPTGYFYDKAPPSIIPGVEIPPLSFIYNEDKKEFDVAICLSMFHHVKNQGFFLKNLKNFKQVLFKINKEDKKKIQGKFNIIKEKEAPGNRIFLLCEAKK